MSLSTWELGLRNPVRAKNKLIKSQSQKSEPVKRKTRPKPKPAWDSTVNDLTVYKQHS